MGDDGYNRSAILLYSLGEEIAADVMRHLGPREVQKIGAVMAAIKTVPKEKAKDVVTEFQAIAAENASLGIGTEAFLRSVLTKALGQDKAPPIIDQIVNNIIKGQDMAGIDGLKWMDSVSIAEMIRNEHPQIIATILAHLDRDQAAEILTLFTERLRNDSLLRLAVLDGIQPQALKDLNEVLAKLLSGANNIKKTQLGGVRVVSEILNFMPGTLEQSVLDNVKDQDEDLAQAILDEMFMFDDLMDIDDRGVQTILRGVDQEMLIVALKGAKTDLREKIFKNMSSRQADIVRDELAARGPMRVSDVEGAQKEILKTVRKLADDGEISLSKGSDEAYV